MTRQSKGGALLVAYITMAATFLSSIVLKPFYLRYLGIEQYGLYIYAFSIAQYAMFLDMGITIVMVRYMAQYKAEGDLRGEQNFAMHCLFAVAILCCIVCVTGHVVQGNMGSLLVGRPEEEVRIGADLVRITLAGVVATIISHYFDGVMLANEQYATVKGVALLQITLKMGLIIAFVRGGSGVAGIAVGDVLAGALCLLIRCVYVFGKLRFRPQWHFFDRRIVRGAGSLMGVMMMQSIVLYANNSVSKILVGSMISNMAVAVYEVAMTFVGAFSELPTITNGLFLPQVMKMVTRRVDGEALTDLVIRVGRYQAILCMAMLGGFVLFGRQFIARWTGAETQDAWLLALVMMIPSCLPLVQNVCLNILTAQDKRLFRSAVLLVIAAMNVGVSYVLIGRIASLGAAVGTAISLAVGDCLIMNIYYQRVLGLNVRRMLREIFRGILPCAVATVAMCTPLLLVPLDGYAWILAQALVFCAVFAVFLLLGGLTAEEQGLVRKMLPRKALGVKGQSGGG